MTNVFGAGNWTQANYATPAATIFDPSVCFVMLEGGMDNDFPLQNFLAANFRLLKHGYLMVVDYSLTQLRMVYIHQLRFWGNTHYPFFSGSTESSTSSECERSHFPRTLSSNGNILYWEMVQSRDCIRYGFRNFVDRSKWNCFGQQNMG
jgi:hypothetical protein